MTEREAPARAHRSKQPPGLSAAPAGPAAAQPGHRPGATAQLAEVHRMLRHGPTLPLRWERAAGKTDSLAGAREGPAQRKASLPRTADGVVQLMRPAQTDIGQRFRIHYPGPESGPIIAVYDGPAGQGSYAFTTLHGQAVSVTEDRIVGYWLPVGGLRPSQASPHVEDLEEQAEFEEQSTSMDLLGSEATTAPSTSASSAPAASPGPIREWLQEKGLGFEDDESVAAVQYTMDHSHLPLQDIEITTSGDYVLTLLPKGTAYVIQFFREDAFASFRIVWEAMSKAGEGVKKHVADIISVDEARRIAVIERIIPFNAVYDFFGYKPDLKSAEEFRTYVRTNLERLRAAGVAAIEGLASLGVSQGDVSLDNMGVKTTGEFALFDYDKARASSAEAREDDLAKLDNSLRLRG